MLAAACCCLLLLAAAAAAVSTFPAVVRRFQLPTCSPCVVFHVSRFFTLLQIPYLNADDGTDGPRWERKSEVEVTTVDSAPLAPYPTQLPPLPVVPAAAAPSVLHAAMPDITATVAAIVEKHQDEGVAVTTVMHQLLHVPSVSAALSTRSCSVLDVAAAMGSAISSLVGEDQVATIRTDVGTVLVPRALSVGIAQTRFWASLSGAGDDAYILTALCKHLVLQAAQRPGVTAAELVASLPMVCAPDTEHLLR
jgi:hypothetical protein